MIDRLRSIDKLTAGIVVSVLVLWVILLTLLF